MNSGAVYGAVRGGIARRRLQTGVVGLVVLVSTASTVLALALVVDSNAPFAHAFGAQRGADVVATVDSGRLSAARLAATGRLRGVTAAAGPFAEVTVNARSGGAPLPSLTLVGRSSPGGSVDDLVLSAGHWPTQPDQVVVSGGAGGSDLGPALGARVELGGAHGATLTVVGLADSVTDSADGWILPTEAAALGAAGEPSAEQMLYRFARAGAAPALHADVFELVRALPADVALGTTTYVAAETHDNGSIAPFVPFLIAFGILGIVMAVLIVANVVGGAVVAGYRRIGILKSLGFTPVQVAAAYAAQAALPAVAGCLLGTLLGNLLALPVLRRTAAVYGVATLSVPLWIDVAVPVAVCVLAALAALLPALHAGRLSTVQAIATGRAPRSGRGYAAHRVFGRLPLPRSVTIGLAAPFARPSRTMLTLAAVLLGACALTFAVGLTSSLGLVVEGLSHSGGQQVQVHVPRAAGGPSFGARPTQAQAVPGAGTPPLTSAAATRRAVTRAPDDTPGTLRAVAEADEEIDVAGLSQQVQATAFRGPASWTGYDLVTGHWYASPNEVLVPTRFLSDTGTAVGDVITIGSGHRQLRVRIAGQLFDNDNDGMSMITSWATLSRIDPGLVPTQYDIGLLPGTSPGAYASALGRKLGTSYYVSLNARNHEEIDAMIGLITLLTLLLAAVAAMGVLNTVVLNTRERVHDLAVFKALGMSPRQMIAMAVSWVAGVGLVAGIVAVPLGMAIHDEVLPQMAASVGMQLPASILDVYSTPELVALGLAGMLIAVLGALPAAGWAAQTRTALALHTE